MSRYVVRVRVDVEGDSELVRKARTEWRTKVFEGGDSLEVVHAWISGQESFADSVIEVVLALDDERWGALTERKYRDLEVLR